jgi:hypothetical protein
VCFFDRDGSKFWHGLTDLWRSPLSTILCRKQQWDLAMIDIFRTALCSSWFQVKTMDCFFLLRVCDRHCLVYYCVPKALLSASDFLALLSVPTPKPQKLMYRFDYFCTVISLLGVTTTSGLQF